MPRITKVYTRTGDDGSTALGTGARLPKDAPRVTAYGAVDELNSALGLALALGLDAQVAAPLRRVQNELFHLGADLCVPAADQPGRPGPRIESRHVEALEKLIDELQAQLEPLANFLLPGGGAGAAQLHVARAVCRRAERAVVRLAREEAQGDLVLVYLNRLSDALFVLARFENHRRGAGEPLWDSRA